jgi:hypothetical protein
MNRAMVTADRKSRTQVARLEAEKQEEQSMVEERTSIQLTTRTRDRLYRLKFRRTYDQFLNELCDLYEREDSEGNK